MYAIVEINGKQYKVEKDMTVEVDRMTDAQEKDFQLDKVLLFVDGETVLVGQPYLKEVKVTVKNLGETKGKKVRGIKFKKRKGYTRTLGHRAQYTSLQISEVSRV